MKEGRSPPVGEARASIRQVEWRVPLSDISEFEASEAMARLLRLAHFVSDHWGELTQTTNAPLETDFRRLLSPFVPFFYISKKEPRVCGFQPKRPRFGMS